MITTTPIRLSTLIGAAFVLSLLASACSGPISTPAQSELNSPTASQSQSNPQVVEADSTNNNPSASTGELLVVNLPWNVPGLTDDKLGLNDVEVSEEKLLPEMWGRKYWSDDPKEVNQIVRSTELISYFGRDWIVPCPQKDSVDVKTIGIEVFYHASMNGARELMNIWVRETMVGNRAMEEISSEGKGRTFVREGFDKGCDGSAVKNRAAYSQYRILNYWIQIRGVSDKKDGAYLANAITKPLRDAIEKLVTSAAVAQTATVSLELPQGYESPDVIAAKEADLLRTKIIGTWAKPGNIFAQGYDTARAIFNADGTYDFYKAYEEPTNNGTGPSYCGGSSQSGTYRFEGEKLILTRQQLTYTAEYRCDDPNQKNIETGSGGEFTYIAEIRTNNQGDEILSICDVPDASNNGGCIFSGIERSN